MSKIRMKEVKVIRVLHFIPAFNIGGIESLVMSLYRNIDKTKIQFDFLVETQTWVSDFDEIISLGGRVHQIEPLNKKSPFSYISQIKKFFLKYKNEYAVVHCHNIERSLIVLCYAKKTGIKSRIFHSHTDSVEDARYEKLTKLIIRLNNRMSTHYLACSKAAGDFFFKKDNVQYKLLKNSIDTKKFSFDPVIRKEIRNRMGLSGYFVVGHTGRMTYQKNHWKIIDIFKEIHLLQPLSKLILVGDGPLRSEIEHKVNELGLSKAVIFTGGQKNISKLLHAMDLFLLPSFFEGFCISLLEAQAVGIRCVASDVIPQEVKLTELLRIMSLDDSHKNWANIALSYQDYSRSSQHENIIKKGYDVKSNALGLMDFYLKSSSN